MWHELKIPPSEAFGAITETVLVEAKLGRADS